MGIVINSSAILASALTLIALLFGFDPLKAFVIGAILVYMPLKVLLPFGSSKAFSETGIMASIGTILAFNTLHFSLLYSFVFGVGIGYFYLYWWLFIFPRILK